MRNGTMNEKDAGYRVLPYPRARQLVVDAGWNARRRHMIHGLAEIDVTDARRALRHYKARTGEALSFTAFVITCLGRAVDADKRVHGYRNWRNQLIVFEDVDVLLGMEVQAGDRSIPLLHPIRAANRRTVRDIHAEIRRIQDRPERSESEGALWLRRFYLLPTPVRRLAYRLVEANPHWHKQYGGTVSLTSVGMFGTGAGWGLGSPVHTLGLILGGIAEKPGVVDDRIVVREYLSVTVSFDHDVVDGAPAARFTQCLKELMESGYGLIDLD